MHTALRRLDSIHSKLLNTIGPIDDSDFTRRPSNVEWSVAEIVHHLCLVELRVIKELEKELSSPPRKLGFFRRSVPTSIVALRLVKVKAPKGMNPVDPPGKSEVVENYNAARSKTKALCAAHGRQRLRQVVFKHPFLGEIDGRATISFLGYHEVRHYKQILDVLKKLNSKN